jgi:hypothetical protein
MDKVFWIKVVKYFEFIVLGCAFVAFIYTLNGMINCPPTDTSALCQDWGIGKTMSLRAISLILPAYAILNSIHIGLDHFINVGENSYTNLFSIGLFGLSFSYILFALFKISPLVLSTAQQNIVLIFIYIVTTITALIFLTDNKLWRRDTIFVKTRIIASVTYLTASAVSPGLGVIVGLIAIPITLLINSKQP